MDRAATASVLLGLLVAGCGPGRDPIDTPVTWWHQLQGGAIAEQRPPPPGVDDPYPLIGTTPKAPPKTTSVAARDALTVSLIDQQGASHQLDTHDPIITTAPPATAGTPPKPGTPPTPGTPPSTQAPPSSATLDAAGTPDPNAPPVRAKPAPTIDQQESSEPVLAMPPPPPGTTVILASGPLPQMPAAPPNPPSFPGFDIPVTPLRPVHPDASGRHVELSNIDYQPGSDVLLPQSHGVLQHVAFSHGTSPIKILAYGSARSDTPDAQAAALRLALARAAAAADILEQLGVPAASIVLAGDAFGRGGTVTVVH